MSRALGPLPYCGPPAPDSPLGHLAAAGTGWATAASRTKWEPMQLVTAPGRSRMIVAPWHSNVPPWDDDFAWWWRHHPERPLAVWPAGFHWYGGVVSVELLAPTLARVRWSGAHYVCSPAP